MFCFIAFSLSPSQDDALRTVRKRSSLLNLKNSSEESGTLRKNCSATVPGERADTTSKQKSLLWLEHPKASNQASDTSGSVFLEC